MRECTKFLIACCVSVPFVLVVAEGPTSRTYAPDYQSQTFFVPRQVQIDAVGILNEGTAFFATRSGIKALHHEGPPTPIVEVDHEEITAFHLCHHRSSIIYEVLSRDGGTLSIYEYSIPVRTKVMVREFQDMVPAMSLACIDQWLLRASPATFQAVHIATGSQSDLRRYQDRSDSNVISSLSVAYAMDTVAHAEVFAVNPNNRTIVRLHLQQDGDGIREKSAENVLVGGEGSDGSIEIATLRNPQHLVWTGGRLIFTDGCMLREMAAGHVRTLVGNGVCVPPANETLEPVPWATRLSHPRALAVATEGTTSRAMLLLTETQIMQVLESPNQCARVSAVEKAHQQHGCGWAQGQAEEEQLCFECSTLERWAASQRPSIDACSLDFSLRRGTWYSLSGCDCGVPSPDPNSDAAEVEAERIQTNLSILLLVAVLVVIVVLYRRRPAITRESNDVDIAEFHVFTDADTCIA